MILAVAALDFFAAAAAAAAALRFAAVSLFATARVTPNYSFSLLPFNFFVPSFGGEG